MNNKIVISDGYTLNPGDLSWDKLNAFGTLSIFDKTEDDAITDRCKDADIIITNKTPIRKATLEKADQLKIIAVTATGYNIVDVAAATQRGVIVCNVPGYGTDSVAQHTFALILELTNHTGINEQSVRRGEWANSEHFCYTRKPIIELRDKVLGIVGYGKIGQQVGEVAKAFGMKVLYYSRSKQSVSLEELFATSDMVSLHCPLTSSNEKFVNSALISKMKSTAFLVNTSRGQLINEKDLADALKSNVIAGAALDVLSKEPPEQSNPLIGLSNCMITPHTAWLSQEARSRIMEITFQNIAKALDGNPQHVV